MANGELVRVIFVCMGNICRSPTAEGVFRHKLRQTGLADNVETDSAGTHAYHVGRPPDRRSQQEALRHGIDISDLRGRQISAGDFDYFDWIIAMDSHNLEILLSSAPNATHGRIHRLLDFAPDVPAGDVPDPYYGGKDGFRHVFSLVDAGCDGLLARVSQQIKR